MKRLSILGIIACVGLLFGPAAVIGNPVGPPGGLDVNVVNTPVYQFAGFSSTTTNGDTDGIGGMHSICQTDLEDASARMCTTKELLLSPDFPTGGSAAWVQPTIVTTAVVGATLSHFDYSGTFYSTQEGTCFQWTFGNPGVTQGMVYDPGGFVATTACNNDIKVACCTPAN